MHHGKVLNEKRTIEENNIGTETTIDISNEAENNPLTGYEPNFIDKLPRLRDH